MNSIDVLYFAWVRERIGIAKERISTNASTVDELVAELRTREPRYAKALEDRKGIRVAVDQKLVGFEEQITGAQEIAFFPPMTGG